MTSDSKRQRSTYNQLRKREQLGLAIGTASGRLRKAVLFRLVQETGRDTCFRCQTKILEPLELVIDHKIAWLDRSPEIFWDIDNIAFSHSRCNSTARRTTLHRRLGPSGLRKVGPPGTAWCGGHAAFLPLESFNRNAARWNGCDDSCKQCRKTARGQDSPRWHSG